MAATVQEELARMRIILQDLESRLDAGEVPPDGLPEFKSAVDEIRLRVWALLTAAGAEAPRATAERFRLRRAAILSRVNSGTCRRSSGRGVTRNGLRSSTPRLT